MKNILYTFILFSSFTINAQTAVYDTVLVCSNNICDTIIPQLQTPIDIMRLFGKGTQSSKKVKFKGKSSRELFSKIVTLNYSKLGLEFEFTSGFVITSQLEKVKLTLRGFKIYNNSSLSINNKLTLDSSKAYFLNNYLSPNDTTMSIKGGELSILYLIPGYHLFFQDQNHQKISSIWIEQSDSTVRKNIIYQNSVDKNAIQH